MPESPAHTSASLLTALLGGLTAQVYYGPKDAVIFSIACLLGEILLSPDLDHDTGARPYRRWGPLRAVWWLYQKLVPHRSPISHWPIVGTAGRLIYLAILIVPPLMLCGIDVPGILLAYHAIVIPIVAGLEASNTTHWLADTLL